MTSRKIGFLHNGSKTSFHMHFAAFIASLHDVIDEEAVAIAERWAGDDTSKPLQQHADDLAASGVAVIVAAGGPPTALAVQKAAARGHTPVVFASVTDPVGLGLVKSLDKPGENMTGVAGMTSELDVTRLELLRELLPSGPANVGVLNNVNRPGLDKQFDTLSAAAKVLNLTLVRRDAADLAGIENAFQAFKGGQKVGAMLVTADSLFNDLRTQVVALARGVPAIFQWREFAEAGGLMSFGPNILDAYEQAGEYAGLILNGEKPADLPVVLPDRFELVINLRVAYADGIKIPAMMLSRAEFVHERVRARHARR